MGLAEEKSEKKEAACTRSTRGLHFEGTYNGETVSASLSLSLSSNICRNGPTRPRIVAPFQMIINATIQPSSPLAFVFVRGS